MTDFETRVKEIMDSEDADYVKLAKIRKLYTPEIEPASCKNDRLYKIVVSDYETIGWRGNSAFPWVVRWRDGSVRFEEDSKITVLGEFRPEDEYVGRVYDRIEDAIADGMGQYTVLMDRDGEVWVFDLFTEDGIAITTNGLSFKNSWAPFTVLHWVPKKVGE